MKKVYRCLWIVPLALVLFLPAGLTGQSKKISTEELTQQSEIVARGKVREIKSQWEGNRERIVTYVAIQVDEYLKGNGPGREMTVVTPGGEIDGVGELYTHTATFRQDEEVVVFAKKDAKGQYRVSGGPQGKFKIEKDETTGRSIVAGSTPVEDFAAEVRKAAGNARN